ncbi:MAG: efflux RND transporter periplasmic adaptor subunit [Pseudorhodobacter sp.]
MGWLKQVPLLLLVMAGALWLWLAYVPGARPLLEGWGVVSRLETWGVPLPAAPDGAAAAARPGAGGPPGGGRGAITVLAERPGIGIANDRVTAIGNGQAARSVAISAPVAGRIAEVTVTSGQKVRTGDLLVRLENEAETIAVERARLVLEDETARRARVARLQSSGAATELQITEAELALRQATLALRQAEFDLSRRDVLAPIDGWVGILRAEPGQQLAAATAVTRIDDRSSILVDFRVPERFVGQIAAGDRVSARPLALRNGALQGEVTAVDNSVDETSRTLLVEARLDNAEDRLRAGMAFEISLSLPGEEYVSINPLSVQWGSDGAFVWRVREGKAGRVPIRIVQRSAEAVLVEGDLDPDDPIVTEGVQSLRPGLEVTIRPTEETADRNALAQPATRG